MLFKDLTEIVNSRALIKIYMIDHVHPTFLVGYAYNPHTKKDEDGKYFSCVDLSPYIAMFNFVGPKACIVGDNVNDKVYNGLTFFGKYATTDFDVHKAQVLSFIKHIEKYGGDKPENVNEYFKLAKALEF